LSYISAEGDLCHAAGEEDKGETVSVVFPFIFGLLSKNKINNPKTSNEPKMPIIQAYTIDKLMYTNIQMAYVVKCAFYEINIIARTPSHTHHPKKR
jgi:hypothetical protein